MKPSSCLCYRHGKNGNKYNGWVGAFYIFEHVLDAVGLQFEVTEKKHTLPD